MTTNFTPAGGNIPARIFFNSGTLDFGGARLVDVDNVSLSCEWTPQELYVLGSIKPADLVRHSQKVMMSGKIKSFAAELQSIALGSSSIGTPNNIYTLDGQPTFTNPVFTGFDRNGKEYQYQLSNALFKSSKASFKAEDFGEFDFELEAMDIAQVVYTQ